MIGQMYLLWQAYKTVHKYEGLASEIRCIVDELRDRLRTSPRLYGAEAFLRPLRILPPVTLTILTFTICPPLAQLWQWFASHSIKKGQTAILIGDSSGTLRQATFGNQTFVRAHLNRPHGQKIDFFLKNYIASEYVLLCDDDVLLIDSVGIDWAMDHFVSNSHMAAVSLKPRTRFKWPIEGQEFSPMGTYCVLFRPEVFRREGLSFRTRHEPSPTPLSYKGEYDTGDYANVALLRRGYEVAILPRELQKKTYVAFNGMSYPIVALRRTAGCIKRIPENHHEWVFRALYAHQLLRGVYRQVGIHTRWSILPDFDEDQLLFQVLDYLPTSRWNEIKQEVEETVDLITQKAQALLGA